MEPVLGRCAPASAESLPPDHSPERYEGLEDSPTGKRALALGTVDLTPSTGNDDPAAAKVIHDRAAYAYATGAATRRNMLKRLKGFCMRELAGTEQRQAYVLIKGASAIVDDHAAWLCRPRADKQALTALREQAKRFRAAHGWLPPPVELDAWEVMTEDRVEAGKYLADRAKELNREYLEEREFELSLAELPWQEREQQRAKRRAVRLAGERPRSQTDPISDDEISD